MEPPLSQSELPNLVTFDSKQAVRNSPDLLNAIDYNDARKTRKRKKERANKGDDPFTVQSMISSCSSSSSQNHTQKLSRLPCKRRSNIVRFGPIRRNVRARDVEAMALPLGMSFAAVVNLILESKAPAGQSLSADDLLMICTLAVRESIANVYGDKFDCFVKNFEKSFGSTLTTLRLINGSSLDKRKQQDLVKDVTFNEERSSSSNSSIECRDSGEEVVEAGLETRNLFTTYEEVQSSMEMDSINRELVLQGNMNQLACVSQNSGVHQMCTIEKSVIEQTRANDLKTLEIGISMKKMRLKEAQLALNYDANCLERSKIVMGVSKATFKAEKFKNQLEDTRHAELLKKCVDCLVAGLLIMASSLSYSAYVYSYKRITEATQSCLPSTQDFSWWIPKTMTTLNTGLHTLKCQVQVVSRMLFGLLMILAVTYLLFQRAAAPKQSMPITFILLLLGILCGFTGKLCVDTLGGSGNHWLILWETLCLLHFFSNICTSALFIFLYGPINVSQGTKNTIVIPYWIRRLLFYSTQLLFLPLLCGLTPFASLFEWKDHFSKLFLDYMWMDEA